MCGVAAIVDQQGQAISAAAIQVMARLAHHRGPNGEGYFHDSNFALGHRRLAIIDLSESASQPMTAHGATIIYNGEIYNYLEIRKELERRGYRFRTASDTEVILAAYDHWGKACLQQFNGMWAFLLYDPRRESLFCARDRFGIKPLYYTTIKEQFCLASEIKQFTGVEGWQPRLNRVRSYEFLAYGWHDHTAETFFKDVFQLPAGHWLEYGLKTHEYQIRPYYQPEKQLQEFRGPFQEATEVFARLFEDSVRLRLRSDVKTGATLSGGLDSSSIVGKMNSIYLGPPFETVSACFHLPQYDEQLFINAVVNRHALINHKVFPSFEEWAETSAAVSWHQEEPTASASVFAQFLVFRKAKEQGLKVMLDGQGADEILCGYEKFYLPFLKQQFRGHPLAAIRLLFGIMQHHQAPARQLVQKFRRHLFSYRIAPSTGTLFQPGFVPSPEELFQRPPGRDVRTTSTNLLKEVGLPVLLHYADRNAMTHSVESRFPFLDYRLVEFCLSLPDEYKISRSGIRKYIQREAMRDILPTKVYHRYDKMGFVTPQEEWVQGARQQMVKAILKSIKGGLEAVFQPEAKELLRLSPDAFWRAWAFSQWHSIFF